MVIISLTTSVDLANVQSTVGLI